MSTPTHACRGGGPLDATGQRSASVRGWEPTRAARAARGKRRMSGSHGAGSTEPCQQKVPAGQAVRLKRFGQYTPAGQTDTPSCPTAGMACGIAAPPPTSATAAAAARSAVVCAPGPAGAAAPAGDAPEPSPPGASLAAAATTPRWTPTSLVTSVPTVGYGGEVEHAGRRRGLGPDCAQSTRGCVPGHRPAARSVLAASGASGHSGSAGAWPAHM
mmetsp:Transcript_4285/g.12519  ORF Transcript_4285/g.12519 Transcript_4285/m.12519 type:complete len:215 (-) Transcript_4285:750-1394(-)